MIRICVLPGDGIGPEVVGETVRVLDALGLDIDWTWGDIGFGAFEKHGTPLPPATIGLVRESSATLLGAVLTPPDIPGYRSPVLGLRQHFGLFANLRPCLSAPHALSRSNVDLVVVRENTEGLYSGIESTEDDGNTALTTRRITRSASERIIRYAFELARHREKKKVTIVHKANVLRETCGLFRRVGLEIAQNYADIEAEDMLVDRCAMELIRYPEQFDVIVTTNLFGDILSDEACMLVGGLGLASSANIGPDVAIFEPVHGSAPDIAGQGIANPLATILSASFMLEHLGYTEPAERTREAVRQSLIDNATPVDLGGQLSTREVGDTLIDALQTGTP